MTTPNHDHAHQEYATLYIVSPLALTTILSEEGRRLLIVIARAYGFTGDEDAAMAEGARIIWDENMVWAEGFPVEDPPDIEAVDDDFDNEQPDLPMMEVDHDF